MSEYVDLHSHWVAGIDDGARNHQDSIDILTALKGIGYGTVIATPHMRTGMFDNNRQMVVAAYEATVAAIQGVEGLPRLGLGSEHHLDAPVFEALIKGNGLPYPGGHAALIEFPDERFPIKYADRMFELRCQKIRPVLAHPERYRPVWKDIEVLDSMLDGGTVLLMDVGALVGKYGRRAKNTAEELLEAGYYYAVCSDAHRASDANEVADGIERLRELAGDEEADFMLREGPQRILDGKVED